ncbi:hypothetical protein AQV86_05110 [Nanohaloarchaea archaeon SG9]|nr:hypothetical protein AQV86_05110 [Nanohaloarchaea archaeon SG9]
MSYDENIFQDEESYENFILESFRQFIQKTHGGKDGFIREASENGVNYNKSSRYSEIIEKIRNNEDSKKEKILKGKTGILEAVEYYSLYKFQVRGIRKIDENVVKEFNSSLKDTKNSKDSKKSAIELCESLTSKNFSERWRKYWLKQNRKLPPVMLFQNTVIGPLGPILKRDKEPKRYSDSSHISHGYEMEYMTTLDLLMLPQNYRKARHSNYPFNLQKTEFVKLLSSILSSCRNNINSFEGTYQKYIEDKEDQLTSKIGQIKSRLSKEGAKCSDKLSNGEIPLIYAEISQLSEIFLEKDEVIKELNGLIGDNTLVVSESTTLNLGWRGPEFKVTEEGIIESSRGSSAFNLAQDVSDLSDKEAASHLIEISDKGLIKYVDELSKKEFETYRELLEKNNLNYEERHQMIAEKTQKRLLESYGINLPIRDSMRFRNDLVLFFKNLEEFEENYNNYGRNLTSKITNLLRDTRVNSERFLKELFTLETLLIEHMRKREDPFQQKNPLLTPTFEERLGFSYTPGRVGNSERGVKFCKKCVRHHLNELRPYITEELELKIEKFLDTSEASFSLGDWRSLAKANEELIEDQNLKLHESLPERFSNSLEETKEEFERFMEKNHSLLNTASHEGAKRKFRNNSSLRDESIGLLKGTKQEFKKFFSFLPGPYRIVTEKEEIDSGLTSYGVEKIGLDGEIIEDSIYGVNIRDKKKSYFILPRGRKHLVEPIIVRDVADEIF